MAIMLAAFVVISIRPAKATLSCTITAISGGYGPVNILSGAVDDSTAAFSVSCTGGSSNAVIRLCVEIGLGSTAAGPSGERVLRSSSDFLDHEFYTSSARTVIWGSWGSVVTAYKSSGLQQDLTLNSSGTGTASLTAFSRVLANQQTKTPGSYTWAGGSSPAVLHRQCNTPSKVQILVLPVLVQLLLRVRPIRQPSMQIVLSRRPILVSARPVRSPPTSMRQAR
jgi:spore coat protein U-like protein